MTVPVLIDILKNSSFKVNLYVAQKFQKIPLPPAYDDRVKAIKLPVYNFAAVRRFSGFIDNANIASELLELKKSLQSTRWQSAIASNAYAAADYNPPWQLQFRVNEVILWFGNTD
ncbi:SOUL heme-binding family protein [Abeliophyllum distichum]|uniref:SOUL heme-binding family protein n=1 Tax=Abeliophyllum distichum TaxID=126358 RepID=A0ABD1U441_9LAMI